MVMMVQVPAMPPSPHANPSRVSLLLAGGTSSKYWQSRVQDAFAKNLRTSPQWQQLIDNLGKYVACVNDRALLCTNAFEPANVFCCIHSTPSPPPSRSCQERSFPSHTKPPAASPHASPRQRQESLSPAQRYIQQRSPGGLSGHGLGAAGESSIHDLEAHEGSQLLRSPRTPSLPISPRRGVQSQSISRSPRRVRDQSVSPRRPGIENTQCPQSPRRPPISARALQASSPRNNDACGARSKFAASPRTLNACGVPKEVGGDDGGLRQKFVTNLLSEAEDAFISTAFEIIAPDLRLAADACKRNRVLERRTAQSQTQFLREVSSLREQITALESRRTKSRTADRAGERDWKRLAKGTAGKVGKELIGVNDDDDDDSCSDSSSNSDGRSKSPQQSQAETAHHRPSKTRGLKHHNNTIQFASHTAPNFYDPLAYVDREVRDLVRCVAAREMREAFVKARWEVERKLTIKDGEVARGGGKSDVADGLRGLLTRTLGTLEGGERREEAREARQQTDVDANKTNAGWSTFDLASPRTAADPERNHEDKTTPGETCARGDTDATPSEPEPTNLSSQGKLEKQKQSGNSNDTLHTDVAYLLQVHSALEALEAKEPTKRAARAERLLLSLRAERDAARDELSNARKTICSWATEMRKTERMMLAARSAIGGSGVAGTCDPAMKIVEQKPLATAAIMCTFADTISAMGTPAATANHMNGGALSRKNHTDETDTSLSADALDVKCANTNDGVFTPRTRAIAAKRGAAALSPRAMKAAAVTKG